MVYWIIQGEMEMTAIYGMVHFLVDFACGYLMFAGVYGTEQWYLCMLLYNFCAFAMQMPMGAAADAWNKNALLAVAGCILIAAAYPLWGASGILCAVMAGLGNGLFHVGGGIDVLNASEKDAGLLGIFVAPGAVGLFLGTLMGKPLEGPKEWPALVLLAAALAIFCMAKKKTIWEFSGNQPVSYEGITRKGALAAALCLGLVVFFRSYLGMIQNFDWKEGLGAGAFIVCATALGKMAGGLLADVAGMKRTAIGSVVLAGFLYLFPGCPLTGILAVFFWNMTMPLTLWAAAKLFPGAKGFVFGLMTFCLFLGFCPVYLGVPAFTEAFASPGIGLGLICSLSLVLLIKGITSLEQL